MTDPSNVHPTLAGNRLDPNIGADGHMNAGEGVGGTSEGTIVKEGVEHVKHQHSDSDALADQGTSSNALAPEPTASTATGGLADAEAPSSQGTTSNAFGSEPPASNPGAEDATGGIAEGSGGLSSTAHIHSPVPNEPEHKTMIGSTVEGIKSYLGWNTQKEASESGVTSGVSGVGASSSDDTTAPSSSPQGNETASGYAHTAGAGAAGLGASAAGGAAALTGSQYAANTADNLEQTKRNHESAAGVSTGTGYDGPLDSSATSTGPSSSDYAGTSTSQDGGMGLNEPTNPSTAQTGIPSTDPSNTPAIQPESSTTMSDSQEPSQADRRVQDKTTDDVPTTEAKGISADERGLEDAETTTGGDKQTEATTDAGQAGAGPGDVGETNKPPAAAGGHSGAIENKSAIPTAGGERLGERHWGESKIVPENPKPRSEETAGVSSKDGQPTDQVKDNTAANTGGATGGPNSSSHPAHATEKEGLVDKIKDKLHIGKK